MPRLRDKQTGVVVVVDDATAATLGSAYEPVEAKSEPKTEAEPEPEKKPAPRRRRARKSA